MFNFDHQFEIHDDLEVLRRMGMTWGWGQEHGRCNTQNFTGLLDLMPPAVHRIITGQFSVLNVKFSVFSLYCLNVLMDGASLSDSKVPAHINMDDLVEWEHTQNYGEIAWMGS